MSSLPRREFLAASALGVAALAARSSLSAAEAAAPPMQIIDTHQHLWDLDKLKLPWLEKGKEPLGKSFRPADYRAATAGLPVRTVYMEVDVAPEQHLDEAAFVLGLCANPQEQTKGAVLGGRPAGAEFAKYLDAVAKVEQDAAGKPNARWVKGIRQVLHGDSTPAGTCLADEYVRGVRLLGERNLTFDLCLRPKELADGIKLTEKCPDTRFILDHCGNADPKAFSKSLAGDAKPEHDAETWKRDIALMAKRPNVICKISGIVARAPAGWKAEHLAPIVNHCLDSFGPYRVVFGGDWPVCLLGASLRQWIDALGEIIASRPAGEQKKLWAENAVKFYGVA